MAECLFDSEVFTDDLTRVIRSSQISHSVRVCLLMTRDRDHAISMLKSTAKACNRLLYHFTLTGRRRYNPRQLRWDMVGGDSSDATELLNHATELSNAGVAILENCVPFLADEGGNLRMRMTLSHMLSPENRSDGLVIIFMEPPESESRLPSMLADQFVRLSVPYPRTDELEAIAGEEITRTIHRMSISLDMETIKTEARRLSSGLVGLTRSAARDALRDALVLNPGDFGEAFQKLQTRKTMQLRRELAMNVLDTSEGEDPVGLDYLIEYLEIRKGRMRLSGTERAKGIWLIGPPGTGKTMLARMIGKIVDLPVVEFRISSLMNSLLGETERRFAHAFSTLEAMAPNVVFMDEIDKVFGASSERDGGTMMRCTGSLLSWMSDNPYPNFIVAASNSLRSMGEIGLIMTRSERFDASFFVDVPDLESRRKMLEGWLGVADVASEIAGMTEKFSGADLRSLVKQATARAEYADTELSLDVLKTEVERKRMRAIAVYDEFQELRKWGRMYCEPAGPNDI